MLNGALIASAIQRKRQPARTSSSRISRDQFGNHGRTVSTSAHHVGPRVPCSAESTPAGPEGQIAVDLRVTIAPSVPRRGTALPYAAPSRALKTLLRN